MQKSDSSWQTSYGTGTVNTVKTKFEEVAWGIEKEIYHTRKVYPLALAGYAEFERTYWQHLLLLLIQEDYITLREQLKNLLNPIWQVLYKVSNAQSPGQ
jgi:hypothetical protein